MKKFLVILLLVCTAGAVFAKDKKNSASLDLFPLFKGLLASDPDNDIVFVCFGLNYERLIAPNFSAVGGLDLYPGKIAKKDGDYFYFGMNAGLRCYPMATFDKLFIGGSLGFNLQAINGKTKEENNGFAGPTISVTAGYKMLNKAGLFFEPSMSYILSKSGEDVTPLGWQGGLRVGAAF
ncbi:MAG: hypothetical protein LBH44_13140 [Treponema sp.]|jgi:hypothetical protein|nr:hypothetical protein [Treponema sp.]